MPSAIHKNKINLPVLKAWVKIFELLECICAYEYDRKGFEDAVLRLYGGDKSSKSVFRGMAIPTLRSLGLIVGFADIIRASANGLLIYSAWKQNRSEGMRALRVVLIEIDDDIGVLSYLSEKSTLALDEFLRDWLGKVQTSEIRRSTDPKVAQERAAHERLLNWINFLAFSELVFSDHENIRLDEITYEQSKKDLETAIPDKNKNFMSYLFNSYNKIKFKSGVSTVEIAELRREVALIMYQKHRAILTEKQFDHLLSDLPKTDNNYVITLGRSMGAEEKLFYYQGKYYQTLFIRSLTSEEASHD